MKHFLDVLDWSAPELWDTIQLAVHLKNEWKSGGNKPMFKGKVLGMIFQKPSLRTRVSFEVAMNHMGGSAIMLGPQEIGLGKRESIADVSRVLSSYVQCIMARVFDHNHVLELAKYSRVPVVNGLSDAQHPCQAIADMLTIYEHFGQLRGLKLAYIGDGNNVAVSLLHASMRYGMNFAIAAPEGYELDPAFLDEASKTGITVEGHTEPEMAVANADVIYTDTWVSMGQEDQVAEREAIFGKYQVNNALLGHANSHVMVLHCLPAHRGQEITDDVADGGHSLLFQQAENRLHAQKAILVKLLGN